jgi:hypothetical protein
MSDTLKILRTRLKRLRPLLLINLDVPVVRAIVQDRRWLPPQASGAGQHIPQRRPDAAVEEGNRQDAI